MAKWNILFDNDTILFGWLWVSWWSIESLKQKLDLFHVHIYFCVPVLDSQLQQCFIQSTGWTFLLMSPQSAGDFLGLIYTTFLLFPQSLLPNFIASICYWSHISCLAFFSPFLASSSVLHLGGQNDSFWKPLLPTYLYIRNWEMLYIILIDSAFLI